MRASVTICLSIILLLTTRQAVFAKSFVNGISNNAALSASSELFKLISRGYANNVSFGGGYGDDDDGYGGYNGGYGGGYNGGGDDDDGYNSGYNGGGDDDDGYNGGYNGGGDDDDGYNGGYYGGGDDDDDGYNGGYNGGGDDDDGYNGGGYGDDDDDNNEVPLDGGLSFLALAGAGLGVKKLRDNMSKRKK